MSRLPKLPAYLIKRLDPKRPWGAVIIHYDHDEDILWIGRNYGCVGDDCIHGAGKLLIDAGKDVVITVNPAESENSCFISSIALTRASKNPFWTDLFRGLETALGQRKKLRFTVDPNEWRF